MDRSDDATQQTPYVGFVVERDTPAQISVGAAMNLLRDVNPSLPAAINSLIGRCGDGLQVFDHAWLKRTAEWMLWHGESDHEAVLQMLRDDIGEGFNEEEHLLPRGFEAEYPDWLFRGPSGRAAERKALAAFFDHPPSGLSGAAAALDRFRDSLRECGRGLRSSFWDDFCEDGCDLTPFCVLRMSPTDCATRIFDGYEECQGNGEGFLDAVGGYGAGAADGASMDAAWRRVVRLLRLAKRLDEVLWTLSSIS